MSTIGIIGAGRMGSAFARRLTEAGLGIIITSKHLANARNVAPSDWRKSPGHPARGARP